MDSALGSAFYFFDHAFSISWTDGKNETSNEVLGITNRYFSRQSEILMSEKNLSVTKPRFCHLLTSLHCEEAVSSLTRHGFPSRGLKRGPSCSDKQHRDGRPLLHLLDSFNLDCLIREPTRKTKQQKHCWT